MFRHVVMFRWKPDTTEETKAAISTGLSGLPAIIPQIRDYRFGPDAGVNEGNYDFVVVADFESAQDYFVYRDDATHRALIAEHVVGAIAERAAVQFVSD